MAVGDERMLYRVVEYGVNDRNPTLVAVPVRETDTRYYPIERDEPGTRWRDAFGTARFIQKRSNLYETSAQVAVAKALARTRRSIVHTETRLDVLRENEATLKDLAVSVGMADLREDDGEAHAS